ncbi:MAG: glycosyl hydrolase family 8, partial [Candidatus Adiutrix sp.]
LPAKTGFIKGKVTTVNPAYYIFPAFADFKRFDPKFAHIWEEVRLTGLRLITAGTNKRTGLIPDWLHLDGQGQLIPPRADDIFGYESIRVPLYLALAQEISTLELNKPLIQLVVSKGYLSEKIEVSGKVLSNHEAITGKYAILARAAHELGLDKELQTLKILTQKRKLIQKGNYYGTVLYLLARL